MTKNMMSFGLDARNAMEFSSLYISSSQYKPLNAVETSFFENFSLLNCMYNNDSINSLSRDLAMRFYQNVVKILQDLDEVLVWSYQVLTKILDLRTLQDSYEIFQDFINLQDLDSYEIFQDFIKIEWND